MDDAETRKVLPWELRGKLPIDPSHALLRHLVAGEVYHDQEPKNEVIVMAAAREMINQLLAGAAKAKLNVIGMNVEPKAVIDCFSHIYRRKHDAEATTFYLDIGCGASRAFIARGQQIFFVRSIPIGGDHFTKAVSQALKISFEEAKLLRIKLAAAQVSNTATNDGAKPVSAGARVASPQITAPAPEPSIESDFPVLGAALQAQAKTQAPAAPPQSTPNPAKSLQPKASPENGAGSAQAQQAELACREPLTRLIEELDLCRRYYEATFPNRPVERMVFIGGEARHRTLCQHIARELGLAAQLGDPMSRMARMSEIGIESGIDRRQPQPSWAVAIGLSLGPVESASGNETQAAATAGAA